MCVGMYECMNKYMYVCMYVCISTILGSTPQFFLYLNTTLVTINP